MTASAAITVGNEDPGWFRLGLYQNSRLPGIVWLVRPDGNCQTVEKGPVGRELGGRKYFAGLMSGRRLIGDLVISRSTGKKSVFVTVLLEQDGKGVGGLGVSVFLDVLSERIETALSLPANLVFCALGDGLPASGRQQRNPMTGCRVVVGEDGNASCRACHPSYGHERLV